MTMNPTIARQMLVDARALVARLEEELAKAELSDLPDQPLFDGIGPKYITFAKRFGKSKPYTYAAVAVVPNKWFITGRQPSDPINGMTWDALMKFMVSEEYEYTRRQVIESYRELR